MDFLESVLEILNEYLQEDLRNPVVNKNFTKENFPHQVYASIYNWITDPIQSPENITQLLDTYLCELDGFSTSRTLKPLVAFTCLEALASIRPEILIGPWEHLVYIIIKDYCNDDFNNCTFTEELFHPRTLKWLQEYSSHELCPNPCLRLELLTLLIFLVICEDIDYNKKKYKKVLISTIYELSSKYSSISMDQIVRCNAIEVEVIMRIHNINFKYITNRYSDKIVISIVKVAGMFALLEKERNQISETIYAKHLIESCSNFFGIFDFLNKSWFSLEPNISDIIIDNHLTTPIAESINAIYDASLYLNDNGKLSRLVIMKGNLLLNEHFKKEISTLPLYHHLREIQGHLPIGMHRRLRNMSRILPTSCNKPVADSSDDDTNDSDSINTESD